MKRSKINPVSDKQIEINKRYIRLLSYLVEKRSGGKCELCGRYYSEVYFGITGHHINKRSGGRIDEPWNILILCGDVCHLRGDNPNSVMTIGGIKYPTFTIEQQLSLARKLNICYNIPETWEG